MPPIKIDRFNTKKNESIGENDRPVTVDDSTIVNVVADAFGECRAFAVATETSEILRAVKVLHALDFLLDDRASVELVGNVMACRADEFHAALVGLSVRVGTDEGGQEAMMNVDQAAMVSIAKPIG